MSLRCAIIDDEPLAIEVIAAHASRCEDLKVVDTFENALEAFRRLRSRPVDVVFLDIEMPELNGLELLRSLPFRPQVIITTAHRDYAVEGFEVDAVDYLLKPISFERFLRAVGRLEEEAKGAPPRVFELRSRGRTVRLPLQDIELIESRRDHIHVHTEGRVIESRYRISDAAAELEDAGFLRVHRSFVVPVARIVERTARDLRDGDHTVPVGRTYRARVNEVIGG